MQVTCAPVKLPTASVASGGPVDKKQYSSNLAIVLITSLDEIFFLFVCIFPFLPSRQCDQFSVLDRIRADGIVREAVGAWALDRIRTDGIVREAIGTRYATVSALMASSAKRSVLGTRPYPR